VLVLATVRVRAPALALVPSADGKGSARDPGRCPAPWRRTRGRRWVESVV